MLIARHIGIRLAYNLNRGAAISNWRNVCVLQLNFRPLSFPDVPELRKILLPRPAPFLNGGRWSGHPGKWIFRQHHVLGRLRHYFAAETTRHLLQLLFQGFCHLLLLIPRSAHSRQQPSSDKQRLCVLWSCRKYNASCEPGNSVSWQNDPACHMRNTCRTLVGVAVEEENELSCLHVHEYSGVAWLSSATDGCWCPSRTRWTLPGRPTELVDMDLAWVVAVSLCRDLSSASTRVKFFLSPGASPYVRCLPLLEEAGQGFGRPYPWNYKTGLGCVASSQTKPQSHHAGGLSVGKRGVQKACRRVHPQQK